MKTSINYFYKYIIDIFLSFLYLYTLNQIRFKYLPMAQVISYDIFIGIYLISNYKTAKQLLYSSFKIYKKLYIYVFMLYLLTCFLGLLSPLIHLSYDVSYFKSIIINGLFMNSLKIFFLIIVTYRITKNKEELLLNFIKYNIGALLISIISTLVFVFFPTIKFLWRNLLYETPRNSERINNIRYITRYSIVGYSGYLMTFRATLFTIFNLILLDIKKSLRKNCLINYFLIFVLLTGNLLYGRVGLMFTIISIFIYSFYDFIYNKRLKLLSLIVTVFVSVFCLFNILKETNSEFRRWYYWAMAPVESFINKGKIGTGSSDEMFERMLFWPGYNTFFFGDGFWLDKNGVSYYKHTDLGIMRPMLYYGVFAQIIGYFIPLIFLYGIYKKGKIWKLLAFLICFQMIFFELKGDAFHAVTNYSFGFFICLYCSSENNKKFVFT